MFKKGSKYIFIIKTIDRETQTERKTTITAEIKDIIGNYYVYVDKKGNEQGFQLQDFLKILIKHREIKND